MELQSEERQTFQRREWAVQRFGTIVLVAFIVAGFLGFLGAGPLATTTTASAQGVVTVEHDWIVRANAETSMHIRLAPDAVEDDTVTLEFTGPWVSGVDLEAVSPEPVEQHAIPDGTALTFMVEPGSETEVSLTLVPQELFQREAQATVADETVSFNQFVLP